MYAQRTLDKTFPQLKPYLFEGTRVLDVGCGPGSITMSVAAVVHPGEVFGIDSEDASIAQANQTKAERQIENVTFQTGDVSALDFGDDEFNVVYAHAVMGWLPRPIEALSEMRRVAKKGAWVVVTLPEVGGFEIYPPCPVYEKVQAIRHQYWTDPEDPDVYYDGHLGRRALELFKEAGFGEVRIECPPGNWQFAGDEPFSVGYQLLWLNYKGTGKKGYDKLFALGVLDEATVIEAQNELKNWAKHPYAAILPGMGFVAAGQT
jgi:SAM-dependent methyltransferase